MTLISSLITSGYREANMLPLSKAPTTNQVTEALALLQTIYSSSFGSVIGYRLADWGVASATVITDPSGFPAENAAAFTVAPNSRLLCALSGATTINLNPYPQDGEIFSVIDINGFFGTIAPILNGNGRLIDGAATKSLTTANFRGRWFYNGGIGGWTQILSSVTFIATADIGIPGEFDDYWIIMLAGRLSPRYGRGLTDETKSRLAMMHGQMTDRYSQTSMRDPNSQAVPEGFKEG